MYARVLPESLMHYRECLLFLAINRKRLRQALSLVDNSTTVLLFRCLVLLRLIEKSTNFMKGLYVYVIMIKTRANIDYELLSKQDLVNIHIRNI